MADERRGAADEDRRPATHHLSPSRSRTTPRPITRRRLLAGAAVGGLSATAGCNAGGDDGAGGGTTTGGGGTTGAGSDGTTSQSGGLAGSVLGRSPGSHVAPTDGFASADWLDAVEPEVVRVTSLESRGEGTLRAALSGAGARIVVFEVGGVIDLQGDHLSVRGGRVFVAGQTAPSPGITLIRGGLAIEANDVVVQHLRVRPGDDIRGPVDAIGNGGGNVIVDHCTASWGSDETLSTNSGAVNPKITYSNNIVAEGLDDSIHPKGPHSMGSLIMNRSKQVTLAGNLWAHNNGRNPRLKGGTSTVVANNLAYNFGRGLHLGGGVSAQTRSSIIGNHYRAGPHTESNDAVVGTTFTDASGGVSAYVAFNDTSPSTMPFIPEGTQIEQLTSRPLWPDALQTVSASAAYDTVLAGAGARPADRTAHDERIVTDVREGTGAVIDSQAEVGGYPDLEATERSLDVPTESAALATWLHEHTVAVETSG